MGEQVRGSLPLRLALDAAGVVALTLAFVGRGDPDVLFHVAWVVLTAESFLYGLRGSLPRIGAAAVVVVVYSVMFATGPEAPPELAANVLFSEWPLMLAIIVMVAVMADREMTTSRRYAGLYRRAADQLITAQEDERQRLARDLHDGVGQTLTAVCLTLDAVAATLETGGEGSVAIARDRVETARTLAAAALHDTRDVAGRLRPSRLSERGLAAAVEDLAATAGIPIDTKVAEAARRTGLLEAHAEVETFRIVQEAVANAARHAHASSVGIGMVVDRGALLVEIVDDGVGFATRDRDPRSLGIAGMRERAAMIGAQLSIRSQPGSGTTVSLSVPIARPEGAGEQPRPQSAPPGAGARLPRAGAGS